MIDVVFLLLVFFMLAARFGQDLAIPLNLGTVDGRDWQGPPRLVQVAPDSLTLNGIAVDAAALPQALLALMPGPDSPVLVQARGANLGRMIALLEQLRAAGITHAALVE